MDSTLTTLDVIQLIDAGGLPAVMLFVGYQLSKMVHCIPTIRVVHVNETCEEEDSDD